LSSIALEIIMCPPLTANETCSAFLLSLATRVSKLMSFS
jgi:hypothetical protein